MSEKGSPAVEEWRRIAAGSSDVLYDICSWPEKRGSWTEEEFYASGASDWEDFRRHWDHYSQDRGGTCVEIGCGAGRITTQLAGSFERVLALDVSRDMIHRARRVVPSNTEFQQVDGVAIPAGSGSVDAVFSVHVMQHLENFGLMARYVADIQRVLRSEGTLMVHIPVRAARHGLREATRAELEVWRSRRTLRGGGKHTTIRTRAYWLSDVWQLFKDTGFNEIELRMIPVRSNGYGHQFWFARAA